jgi:hypothetical protein
MFRRVLLRIWTFGINLPVTRPTCAVSRIKETFFILAIIDMYKRKGTFNKDAFCTIQSELFDMIPCNKDRKDFAKTSKVIVKRTKTQQLSESELEDLVKRHFRDTVRGSSVPVADIDIWSRFKEVLLIKTATHNWLSSFNQPESKGPQEYQKWLAQESERIRCIETDTKKGIKFYSVPFSVFS